MKKIALVTLAAVLILSASFAFAQSKKLVIGTSVYSTEIEYFKILSDAYKKSAPKYNVQILATDGEKNVTKQIQIVEDFISKNVDGIIISAVNPDAERQVLEEAMKAGIPVLLQGQERVEANWTTANVGYSEADMGRMAGELVAEKINNLYLKLPVLKVAAVGFPKWPSCIRRADASVKGLRDNVKGPKIEVVINQEAGTRQAGLQIIETALQANPDLRCVVSINDAGAIGAGAAFEAAGIDVVKECAKAGCTIDRG